MFKVLRNRDRVLVTGRGEDAVLLQLGWTLVGAFDDWTSAYKAAVKLAEREDLILEWYLEEELAAAKATLKAIGGEPV